MGFHAEAENFLLIGEADFTELKRVVMVHERYCRQKKDDETTGYKNILAIDWEKIIKTEAAEHVKL